MSSWRDRESETQVRSRVANESTARAKADAPASRASSFRCECGDRECSCAILLTHSEYEAVRAYDTHFAVARNHENPEREGLIEEHEYFTVVETMSGEAVKRARRTGRGSAIGGITAPGSAGRARLGSLPAGIELLNVHWHDAPGAHDRPRCPACDIAVASDEDGIHRGGELYHPACALRRGWRA
jgi:hypothetical protein